MSLKRLLPCMTWAAWATDKCSEPKTLAYRRTEMRNIRGRRRRVADAKPGNLSFNLQLYISHFKDRHILFTHDLNVSKNISELETHLYFISEFIFLYIRRKRFSCESSILTDPLKGSDKQQWPIRLPKSGSVVIGPGDMTQCELTVMGCKDNLAGRRLACCGAR